MKMNDLPSGKDSNKLDALLEALEKSKTIEDIFLMPPLYDEPKIFGYSATARHSFPYYSNSHWSSVNNKVTGKGTSFFSKHLALVKCIGELVERYCLFRYPPKPVTQITLNDVFAVQKRHLDLRQYRSSNFGSDIENEKFGWINGYDLMTNKSIIIPEQLIYLSYLDYYPERKITNVITSGAASGYSHESTMIRGIYEAVERDAFMTTYLTQAPISKIAIDKIKNKKLNEIISSCKRYHLSLFVFDITNDLQIPTFMTFLIDYSGVGPALTVGAKSSFNVLDAIIGSIEEACMPRPWVRGILLQKDKKLYISPEKITSMEERAIYWSKLKHLKFFSNILNQNEHKLRYPLQFNKSPNEELRSLVDIFSKKGYSICYADIGIPIFKKCGIYIYKVLIPQLQTLYLNEKTKQINKERLDEVARYFHMNKYSMPSIPHPFL